MPSVKSHKKVAVETHENNQHTKNLEHQPPITRYTGVVFKQFPLSSTDIGRDIYCVSIDPLYCFTLFCNHMRQLSEYLAQFRYCRLD